MARKKRNVPSETLVEKEVPPTPETADPCESESLRARMEDLSASQKKNLKKKIRKKREGDGKVSGLSLSEVEYENVHNKVVSKYSEYGIFLKKMDNLTAETENFRHISEVKTALTKTSFENPSVTPVGQLRKLAYNQIAAQLYALAMYKLDPSEANMLELTSLAPQPTNQLKPPPKTTAKVYNSNSAFAVSAEFLVTGENKKKEKEETLVAPTYKIELENVDEYVTALEKQYLAKLCYDRHNLYIKLLKDLQRKFETPRKTAAADPIRGEPAQIRNSNSDVNVNRLKYLLCRDSTFENDAKKMQFLEAAQNPDTIQQARNLIAEDEVHNAPQCCLDMIFGTTVGLFRFLRMKFPVILENKNGLHVLGIEEDVKKCVEFLNSIDWPLVSQRKHTFSKEEAQTMNRFHRAQVRDLEIATGSIIVVNAGDLYIVARTNQIEDIFAKIIPLTKSRDDQNITIPLPPHAALYLGEFRTVKRQLEDVNVEVMIKRAGGSNRRGDSKNEQNNTQNNSQNNAQKKDEKKDEKNDEKTVVIVRSEDPEKRNECAKKTRDFIESLKQAKLEPCDSAATAKLNRRRARDIFAFALASDVCIHVVGGQVTCIGVQQDCIDKVKVKIEKYLDKAKHTKCYPLTEDQLIFFTGDFKNKMQKEFGVTVYTSRPIHNNKNNSNNNSNESNNDKNLFVQISGVNYESAWRRIGEIWTAEGEMEVVSLSDALAERMSSRYSKSNLPGFSSRCASRSVSLDKDKKTLTFRGSASAVEGDKVLLAQLEETLLEEVQESIPVLSSQVGILIGRNGATAARIRSESLVEVYEVGRDEAHIILRGRSETVQKAKQMITEVLRSDKALDIEKRNVKNSELKKKQNPKWSSGTKNHTNPSAPPHSDVNTYPHLGGTPSHVEEHKWVAHQ